MRRPRRDRPLAIVSLASYPCLLRGVAVCYTRVTFFWSMGAPFRPEVRQEGVALVTWSEPIAFRSDTLTLLQEAASEVALTLPSPETSGWI